MEITMPKGMVRGMYPAVIGILLGLLQTGLFFQLSFTLSSSFRTYLMITVCWLVGSAIGVQFARQVEFERVQIIGLLFAALGAYFGCVLLLHAAPFNSQWWFIYALLVIVMGLYPGAFFVRLGKVYTARLLFFWENNGFIVGIIAGTLLFMLLGRSVLLFAPLMLAGVIITLPEPVKGTKI